MREAEEKAKKPTVDKIRERAEHYARQREMSATKQLEHDMSIAGHGADCPHCQGGAE